MALIEIDASPINSMVDLSMAMLNNQMVTRKILEKLGVISVA
jgi:hypothetical protein